MPRSWGFLALAIPLVLASCGPVPQEPRAIRPESDVCPECRMTVIPRGYAAESVDAEGQVLTFDDVGCLALNVHDHPEHFVGAAFFIEDAQTRAWVALDKAVFVRALEAPTPMNYGWHTFSSVDAAQGFAAEHQGTVAPAGTDLADLAADLEGRRWQP